MLNIKSLVIYVTLAVMSFASLAQSQDLMGFDRSSYGSVVLSQTQSVGTDIQLELSIGNYENEPIINYSSGSVFAQIGRSVGRLDVLTDKGIFPCTAFIVSEKYILTNYHCSKGLLDNEKIGASRIDATQFVAGYTQTGIEEGTKKYTVIPTPIEASKTLDYAVLEVIGNPSQEYGQLKLASTSPTGGDPFWIIGHPMGEGQRISREKCKANTPALSSGKLLHTCDTLPGNSGSPVIDAGLQQVVALHHAGSKADSVNFAILMSEILANSKVLTAYKAPLSVQQVAPKTAEITACDALYSAAAEAKACFAYEAYFKSCRDHSLAPIAKGYINEFCKVQETANVDVQPTQTCSQNAKLCGDEQICSIAATNGRWDVRADISPYKQEAQKRGLTCGVVEAKTEAQKICSVADVAGCDDKTLCNMSTFYQEATKTWSMGLRLPYVTEAKKRGLNCGVGRKLATSTKDECPATIVELCNSLIVCDRATYNRAGNIEWLGDTNLYVKEAKTRGLTCEVGAAKLDNANFKKAFTSQPKLKRQQLQYALKKLGHYSYGIDGLWGKGTSSGLDKFVNGNGLKGKTEAQVFSNLLSRVKAPSFFKKVFRFPTNWKLDITCSGRRFVGNSKFLRARVANAITKYDISYQNQFSDKYNGTAEIDGKVIRFNMKHFGTGTVVSGEGILNAKNTWAAGVASDGCKFQAFAVK
ncbi:serine protease [Planktomarina temperata]|nr:serine protease [Planktomarina temperata]